MMSEYNISKAIAGDEAAIIGFQMAMAMETEGLALEKERVQQGVRAVMDDNSRGVYIVAKEGGTPVASLMVTREWSDWNNRWYWWVQSVYVMPQHRKKGVLRAMYSYVKELAREEDVTTVRLYVDRNNHRAQSAYGRLGMAECHYLMYEDEIR